MTTTIAWISLIFAGIFEVIWTYFLKQSQGFSKLVPTIFFIIAMIGSLALLAVAVRELPISIAYPVWTAIGAVGSVLIGTIFFGESLTFLSSIFLMMIIGGVIGLKIFS